MDGNLCVLGRTNLNELKIKQIVKLSMEQNKAWQRFFTFLAGSSSLNSDLLHLYMAKGKMVEFKCWLVEYAGLVGDMVS